MTAPFFFPEYASGSGWGGPARDHREKTLVFPRESPTMQPLGFGKQAARPVLLLWGFLTWAAKPRVGKSPEPRKILGLYSNNYLRLNFSLHQLLLRASRDQSSHKFFRRDMTPWTLRVGLG